MTDDLNTRMVEFVQSVTTAMGLAAEVSIEPIEDGTRIVVEGADCEVLVRRKAAALDALQHIVNAAFSVSIPGGTLSSIAWITERPRTPSCGRRRNSWQNGPARPANLRRLVR